ncbi:MoaD/ThiS family protein [Streptomyces sp. NPDC006602]|uniref:MoaD/ThiS family protein n=1 Tax=unclassified Streptomyces TaxID=2593676 RepID=UPI00214B4E0E|nr:MoaD/ThiS family protein [Streptomyces sp. DSM 40750]UUU19611.1 MoaD/ThiS family protein [Streptomyces sp. DSM 40750]UUU27047.1 MoaD/ThiS family protein [Streptomyces sp. DSM 40750]
MPTMLLFAAAREAAGRACDVIPGSTLGEVLDEARRRYGGEFAQVLANSRVWLNGETPYDDMRGAPCEDGDEIAVLPPISGG